MALKALPNPLGLLRVAFDGNAFLEKPGTLRIMP